MRNKTLVLNYVEYDSLADMPAAEAELMRHAINAASTAYVPYSNFHVGAAVRLANSTIMTGSNQENIAYPSGLCAERTALFSASAAHPEVAVESLAIVGRDAEGALVEASPCGACRQVMAEYEHRYGNKMVVLCYLAGGKVRRIEGVDSLLPFGFDAEL